MQNDFPKYQFTEKDTEEMLARFVRLDNPGHYSFDEFHAHEYHELMVFTKGGGRHNINFQEYAIADYSVHLLASGDVHLVERGRQSEGFALVFNDAFLIKLKELNPQVAYFEFLSKSGMMQLSGKAEDTTFRMLISEIIRNQQDRDYNLSLIAAFLTKLVLCFPERIKESNIAQPFPLVIQLIGLINRHFSEHLSAAAYSEKMGCSVSVLERKAKAATGKTIAQLQEEKQLNEAKRLLFKPDSAAKEIAYTLGFNNESYFSRWFKKMTGLPPLKFKNNFMLLFWALFYFFPDNLAF